MTNDDFTKKKLWGGRFSGKTDPLMHQFNRSIHTWGSVLYAADIKGSKAYAKSLERVGILTEHENVEMQRGLDQVKAEWDQGKFVIQDDDEDIFTANERRLSEIVGSSIGGKLHTGRSRNDQTTTDFRLWLMDQARDMLEDLKSLIHTMASRAEAEIEPIMPGYTHLQRAQPVRWAHWLLAHAHSFEADAERLAALIPRISVLPLGSSAMAGNPYGVDREFLRQELGFERIGKNSMHMVADRDYAFEFLQWSSILMVHMSRLAEDLITYSSAEFGFVTISDAYSTGSSIMPQKKNADSLEIVRGKSGTIMGLMTGVMISFKGLPLTYNKDMAEDKQPVIDCARQVGDCIKITEGVVATLTINPKKMQAALTMDMLATDFADYLVRKGIPFRASHHVSGRAVALAEKTGRQLNGLTVEEYKGLSDVIGDDVLGIYDFETSVESKSAIGGTSRASVLEQAKELKDNLSRSRA